MAATRDECLKGFVQHMVDGIAEQSRRSPREAAEAAHYPGHRLSVDQLEDVIRERRGLSALDRAGVA